eukprot:4151621-Prymnesium_polylepis.1
MDQVPGTSSAQLWVCCAPSSAMPKRSLAHEKPSAQPDTIEEDEEEGLPSATKLKTMHGDRARAFFAVDGCHGAVQ